MFPILRRHSALWPAWVLTASTLLFMHPWVTFSWAELAACVGPLLIAVDRRIGRERLLVLGLILITLLAVVDPTEVSLLRLLGDTVAFVGGVLFGARAVDDQVELEAIAGHLALGPDPAGALRNFRRATAREIGRARRHDRSFVILSLAPAARELASNLPVATESRIMAQITLARWLLELRALLVEEVHLYADVVATEQRILCLVPEVEPEAIDSLVSRLESACRDRLAISVDTGRASFPRDALGVDDLIEVADRVRCAPKLESMPSAFGDMADLGPTAEDPRAQVVGKGEGASLHDANR